MSSTVGVWELSPSVVEAALDDEMVLLNVESGLYFGLDGLGTAIWTMVSEGMDEDAIVTRIVAEYDVARAQAEGDVCDFLRLLENRGLLRSSR